ncbi:MAG: transporter substrate-binding protein, partial [Ilumatobacteraceae bacterium]
MRKTRRAAFGALITASLVFAAACGGDDDDASDATDAPAGTSAGADAEAAETTVAEGTTPADTAVEDTASAGADAEGTTPTGTDAATECAEVPEGDTVKVGVLHSLSGTMSISEVAVRDAELLAIKEINEAGGVLGHQIEPVVEDGASDWPTFTEKAEKLLTTDEVAAVFGGWTSASRKAMLPVFEGNNGLLYYPVQYEGLEASPNIFYTGATTNQQIIPAVDYLLEQGKKKIYLLGSDYVFPR